jgi:hypothetical protein
MSSNKKLGKFDERKNEHNAGLRYARFLCFNKLCDQKA